MQGQQVTGEVGTSDIVPDQQSLYYSQRVIQRNDSLSTAFNSKDLLKDFGIGPEGGKNEGRMSQISYAVSQGGIRKTALQIQREQNAALARSGTQLRVPLATQSLNSV